MIYEPIGESCAFFYHEDAELLFAAASLLQNEPAHKLCSQVYGSGAVAALQKKYRFLFELSAFLGRLSGVGMLEFLLDLPLESFSLEAFSAHVRATDARAFILRHMGLDEAAYRKIAEALAGNGDAEEFFGRDDRFFKTYLGMQTFFTHTAQYADAYCALAAELRTDDFLQALEQARPRLEAARADARERLKELPPLQYAEQLMGKTFRNRGPYTRFIFSASLFMPFRAVRFFDADQLLFTTLRSVTQSDADTVTKLKAVADQTRLGILTLLGGQGAMRGIDIARALGLSPSTVTHHMEQLRGAGLLHEEPVKNAKYFSLDKRGMEELIARLTKMLR